MASQKNSEQEKKDRKTKYSAPALEKGLDILELLAKEPGGLGQSEVAKRLNRSIGEIFRMLVVLENRGYIAVRPGTDIFVLSLKMFELSHRFPPIKKLVSAASERMKELAYELEQSCHLVVYFGGKGHVVAQQDPLTENIFSVRLGAEVVLSNSCSGHILLSFANDIDRQRMLGEVPEDHKKLGPRSLKQVTDRVREQGHESIESSRILGVHDIGYPIFDHTGSIVAALVVPYLPQIGQAKKEDLEKARLRLEKQATAISVMLGFNLSDSSE